MISSLPEPNFLLTKELSSWHFDHDDPPAEMGRGELGDVTVTTRLSAIVQEETRERLWVRSYCEQVVSLLLSLQREEPEVSSLFYRSEHSLCALSSGYQREGDSKIW